MDGKMLARLGAIVLAAVAITATVAELTRKDEAPASSPVRPPQTERDPRREGQRRCQQLGEAAAKDAACLRVWAEARDRFLGRAPAASHPAEGR